VLVVGEIEGLFFSRVSHAKRKFEPAERLASTHIHTSFQHCQHSLNTFHTHTAASIKRDRRKSLCALQLQVSVTGTSNAHSRREGAYEMNLTFIRYSWGLRG